MSRTRKRYSSQLKFQVVDIPARVVLEALTGEKTPRQIAKAYGMHPNSISLWKRTFLERGPEVFARDGAVREYERSIARLERLLGKKEVVDIATRVEIALLKNFLGQKGRRHRCASCGQAGQFGLYHDQDPSL